MAKVIRKRLSAWMRRYAEIYPVSGNILVARNNEVLYRGSFGFADCENRIPNGPKTRFKIGSVTKQFTAAAILLLQSRGKLDVRDKIARFLPDYPGGGKISIHHLLCHSSGIPNYTDVPGFLSMVAAPASQDRIIRVFRDKKLRFKPGTKAEYSNSGYTLLGRIIEAASGVSYGEFVRTNILEPLSLRDTGTECSRDLIPRKARGYGYDNGRILNASFIHMSWPYSAGNMYSTAQDLHRWNLALHGGKLLPASLLEEMRKPRFPLGQDQACYGLMTLRRHRRRVYLHSGGIFGFVCLNIHIPSLKTSIMGLFNLSDQNLAFLIGLMDIVLGKPAPLPVRPKKVLLDAAQTEAIAGSYASSMVKGMKVEWSPMKDGSFRMTVRYHGSIEPPEEHVYFPSAPTCLRHTRLDTAIGFWKDKKTNRMRFWHFEKTSGTRSEV
jgi:CubicO group peptidase (beta-lactamase class C family)